MASIAVFRQGQTEIVTVPASSAIAVWTEGKATIWQVGIATTIVPGPKVLLTTVSAGVPYTSSAFASGAKLIIECQQEAPVYYEYGVSPLVQKFMKTGYYQPVPGTLNATGALTTALLATKIVTSTTGAAVAGTLDTGTVMDTNSIFAVGDSFDWTIINTGGNTFTVTAAAGHTVVGVAAVATVTSATFRTKKTAANTFVTYRLAG